ncbi:MAG: LysM peptidoglycan-binding domain-containing protein [Cyclobacteriaceae bacterium]
MRCVFILFSLISFSAGAVGYDSIRSERRTEGLFVIHEVEEEETLYSIARRYNSSVNLIVTFNEIVDNRIDIGQILSVLVEESESNVVESDISIAGNDNMHLVEAGETLYSISKKYDVKLRDLRRLNNLEDNSISPGQSLKIVEDSREPIAKAETIPELSEVSVEELVPDDTELIPDGFEPYHVQTGETLISIARKRSVAVDSIKGWNSLDSDYLRIGQKLFVRISGEPVNPNDSTEVVTKLDNDGFERIYEEGIAGVIPKISTAKYLALHRTLPIGTALEVRNLMNNLVVHVKIVGRLPNTGINRNLLVRLSKPAFEQLGILDSKSRVEVSYFKE